jgi:deoxycytidylate deaminase
MERIGWEETWLDIAKVMSRRSGCARFQAGAVIVDVNNRVVATGYNGPPAYMNQTCATDCPRAQEGAVRSLSYDNCIAIHAEANALMFCDRKDREGGSIYVNAIPCLDCAKLIANSGLRFVIVIDDKNAHRNFDEMHEFFASCEVNMWKGV